MLPWQRCNIGQTCVRESYMYDRHILAEIHAVSLIFLYDKHILYAQQLYLAWKKLKNGHNSV